MAEYLIQDTTLTGIADAIRERNKTTDEIAVADMPAKIKELPPGMLDTSTVTNWKGWFRNSERTDTIPYIDTSNGVFFDEMFQNATAIKFPNGKFPLEKLNTSRGVSFSYMFSDSLRLSEVSPVFDTSNGEDFSYMFYRCLSLEKAPLLNTSKGVSFQYMYAGCSSLKDGGVIDMTSPYNASGDDMIAKYMFTGCTKLEKLKIKVNGITSTSLMYAFYLNTPTDTFTDFEVETTTDENGVTHGIKIDSNNLSFASHNNLSIESLLSVLNALEDNTGEETMYNVYLGAGLGKLTSEQKQIAYRKNINLK